MVFIRKVQVHGLQAGQFLQMFGHVPGVGRTFARSRDEYNPLDRVTNWNQCSDRFAFRVMWNPQSERPDCLLGESAALGLRG